MHKTLLALLALLLSPLLQAQPIRIGEINSYKEFPAHLEPYRKGWRLAQEQINAAGGVNGRRIEVVSRDDGFQVDTAVRLASQLVSREKVHVLMGGFTSSASVALAEYAAHRKVLYMAALPLTDELVGKSGNRYTFRLRPSAALQMSILLPEAIKLNRKRWAIVYPHNTYDHAALAAFRTRLMKEQPSIDVVYEQVVPLGRIDAWGIARWIEDNEVQAVVSMLFGSDLRDFVAAGNSSRLFEHVKVLNPLAGQPEDLALLKGAAPEGWWVTGYPGEDIEYGVHTRFVAEYRKRWGEPPGAGSVLGYAALHSIAHAVRRAKSTDTEKLVEALEGLEVPTPVGVIGWRKSDHQSTMGAFVGQLANKGTQTVMVRWRFEGSVRHLPPEP